MISQEQVYDYCSEPCLGSDESRTGSVNKKESSSKDVQQDKDEGWLQ